MCGISVVCERGPAPAVIDRLRSMHARVPHRGPDGEGWLVVDVDWTTTVAATEGELRQAVGHRPIRVAAAFRWLLIQDRHPSSCQPMGSRSGEAWILFNGEIYNHQEVRRALIAEGRDFRTNSDTEALLVAYEQWGPSCFERLNGMWGAVIIDTRARSITISRDRFGIRPLFYRLDAGRLMLSSEAKQISSFGTERLRPNRSALLGFLRGRRLPAEDTFFEDVRGLPAATFATIPLDTGPPASLEFRPYWTLDRRGPGDAPPISLAAAASALERLLQDSVRLQSVAAVPVGVLLSGGLDSSVVSALLVDARRPLGQHSTLVSVTSDEATGHLDERPYMRAMADTLAGADVTAVESALDASWVEASMDRVTWHLEEPPAGIALIAQYRAYHAAAEQGLRVVLEGTGSDEIFGGYPRHQLARIRDHVRRREWLDGARELAGAYRGDSVFGPWFRELAGASVRRRLRIGAPADRPAWMTGEGASPTRGRGGAVAIDAAEAEAEADMSMLARMSLADLTRGNVPAVLAVTDRNAMAHSVESRVPYLDHRLVEFAFGLPDDLKTSRGVRKVVLREVARRRLPALVAERRGRTGFGMPIREWLRGPLRTSVVDAVHGPAVTQGDVFEPATARRFVMEFLSGAHDDVAAVWRIYAAARWLQVYGAAM